MFETGRGCSSRVQIKDSGLTQSVDDEMSPLLAVVFLEQWLVIKPIPF